MTYAVVTITPSRSYCDCDQTWLTQSPLIYAPSLLEPLEHPPWRELWITSMLFLSPLLA
jgi:hypothetical protein